MINDLMQNYRYRHYAEEFFDCFQKRRQSTPLHAPSIRGDVRRHVTLTVIVRDI